MADGRPPRCSQFHPSSGHGENGLGLKVKMRSQYWGDVLVPCLYYLYQLYTLHHGGDEHASVLDSRMGHQGVAPLPARKLFLLHT